MLLSQFDLANLNRSDVDRILYQDVKDNEKQGDCILVFGSQKCLEYRLPKAIQLYEDKRSPLILLSGGNVWGNLIKTEAELMKEKALQMGIPEKAILLESKSKYTAENVQMSAKVMDLAIGLDSVRTLLLVTTTYHMRRCFLSCKTYLPEHIQYVLCPVDDQNTKRTNWYLNERGKARAIDECKKLIAYVQNGHLVDMNI